MHKLPESDGLRQITMLRKPGVRKRYMRAYSTMYADIAKGVMVPPVSLGARFSVWPEHEVDAVIAARIAGADDDEVRKIVARLVAQRAAGRS